MQFRKPKQRRHKKGGKIFPPFSFDYCFSPAGGFAFAADFSSLMMILPGGGIPGVGVAPGFCGFFRSSADGIPSAGETFEGTVWTDVFAGIPGVVFALGCMGFVESPGGRFVASTATFGPELALAELELATGVEPHAVNVNTVPTQTNIVLTKVIKYSS